MSDHIHKMLCLSTSHVKMETMRRLQDGDFDWLVSYRKEAPTDPELVFGAFVCADSIDVENSGDTEDIPEDLMEVLHYADAFDCKWIMFDVDGDTIGDLPTYSW